MKKLTLLLAISYQLLAISKRMEGQYTNLINFTGTSGSYNGWEPYGSLIISGDTLYGMTQSGGISTKGNIFSLQTNGTNYKDLVDFTGTSGSCIGEYPMGSLILSGDTLYGMTNNGGTHGYGDIFSVQTNGTNYKDLVDFTGTSGSFIGADPLGSLTISGDTLYGMNTLGGIHGVGNIFSVQTNGTNYRDLVDFTGTAGSFIGADPRGSLTISGDTLYGMTTSGGTHGDGNIFSVQTNGTNYRDLVDFTGFSGSYTGEVPWGSLILSGDTLYGMTSSGGVSTNGNIFSVLTNGTNYTDLIEFSGNSGLYIGESPQYGSLTLSDNTLYGMTLLGGTHANGNIFSVQTNGTNYKDLVDFTGLSGSFIGEGPFGSLNISGGTLYGMTEDGGVYSDGNLFRFILPCSQDSIASTCATCCNCKGTTHVYVWGGTPPYTYLWSNGRTYDTLQGLSSDTFRVTVTDANGCSIKDTVFVPLGDHITASQTNVSCNGGSTGGAEVSLAGNYTYLWSPGGQTTSSLNGLSAGTYSVSISSTDTIGCITGYGFSISQPPPLSGGVEVTCCGYNYFNLCEDSSCYFYRLAASGGTPPYTYTGGLFSNPVCYTEAGNATVTDANECIYTFPAVLEVGLSIRVQINNNVSCNGGNNGSATVHINTGGEPFQTYNWSPSGGTNQTAVNLSAGTYTVTVTQIDPNCRVQEIFVITQPAILNVLANVATNISCNSGSSGSISATVSGGTSPYTYLWSDANSQTTVSASGIATGTYTIKVTDNNGCTASALATITQPTVLAVSANTLINVACNGENNGRASANVSGGTVPYTYLWSDAGSQITATATGLIEGTYTIIVKDSCDNSATASVIITQPSTISMIADSSADNGSCNGSAWAIVNGGTNPYSYFWTGGLTTDTITNQCANYYCCTITDANGCIDSVCITIPISISTEVENITNSSSIFIYPDPNNGTFTLLFSKLYNIPITGGNEIEIFDVFGRLVYTTKINSTITEINIGNQSSGVYFYKIFSFDEIPLTTGKFVVE